MRKRSGRLVAITAVVVGLTTFVVAGIALKDRAVEQWYIWKLDSEDFTERFRAALELGDMHSKRAMPKLVTLLRESDYHSPESWAAWNIPADFRAGDLMVHVFRKIGPASAPELIKLLQGEAAAESKEWRAYTCKILGILKAKDAVPQLIKVIQGNNSLEKVDACEALGSIGPDAGDAIPALIKATRDPNPIVRFHAEEALKKIQGAS